MGAHSHDLTPHQSVRHFFGAELRHRRQAAGLSQADLARMVLAAPSLVNKVELAQRFPSAELTVRCDRALDAREVLIRLHGFAVAERAAQRAGAADQPPTVGLTGLEAVVLRRLLLAMLRPDGSADPVAGVLERIDVALAGSGDARRRRVVVARRRS